MLMYLQWEIRRKKNLLASWKPLAKREESGTGSVSQYTGSLPDAPSSGAVGPEDLPAGGAHDEQGGLVPLHPVVEGRQRGPVLVRREHCKPWTT